MTEAIYLPDRVAAMPDTAKSDQSRGARALRRAPGMRAADDRRRARSHPFADTQNVRGRPSEVALLIDEALSRLGESGFVIEDESAGSRPTRVCRLRRADEWLVLVAASASKPHRLHLPNQYEVSVSGEVRNAPQLHRELAELPFTALEMESLARDMPLTASTPRRIEGWLPSLKLDDQPLAGCGAIFTIHHQTDFLLLLEKALELGIDASLVTVIDKEYRYRYSRRVDAHIRRRLGVPVYTYSQLKQGIASHIRRVVESFELDREHGLTPTVVVDDGGYILPCLHEHFEPFLSLFRGVVEQTMSGIWKLEPYRDLRVPIFSVAESDLKATVEAHGVAQAALTSLRRLLPHESFDARAAVVVGFGRIGQALSEILCRHNVEVHVVDTEPAMLVAARERGFKVASSLSGLLTRIEPRYLFACARPGAVDAESLLAIRCDCVLASVASRDESFDKEALETRFRAEPLGSLGTRYTQGARSLLLVADGFPVNFHFSESMPNQQSDLVMASLLVGAVSLAHTRTAWPPGNDPSRANAVLAEGTLLDDFLSARPTLGPATA
jgi:S-adenosylhomocysteine hydrolase